MNKDQLKRVIASKNDDNTYRLILKTNGEFELIDMENWLNNKEQLDYVTDWEYFFKGDNYVGKMAAKDEYFINDLYAWAEDAWNRYKECGETKIINVYSL